MVKRLKREGIGFMAWMGRCPNSAQRADDFIVANLRDALAWTKILDAPFDEAHQFAAIWAVQDIFLAATTMRM